CEKPTYIQLDFLIRRFAEQANADASLRDRQPYKAAVDGDLQWFGDAVTKHYEGDDSGNSNGDIEMLQYTDATAGSSLSMLVLHDDADREFDYVAGAEKALDKAKNSGWTVVSMKSDWNTVFGD
ncbi:MAG TPA: hypothetical protein VE759_06425, partial [Mycobacterium sp.]|nr:hypothetical protein [Mycobacterium sp.]